jgi:hypothetical protein
MVNNFRFFNFKLRYVDNFINEVSIRSVNILYCWKKRINLLQLFYILMIKELIESGNKNSK